MRLQIVHSAPQPIAPNMNQATRQSFIPAPPSCYVERGNIASSTQALDDYGFLVIKNAVNTDTLREFANSYFRLFPESFQQTENNTWKQFSDTSSPHGVGSHPANSFVRSDIFSTLLRDCRLNELVASHFPSTSQLLPRVILRCFTNYSTRHTLPHRDKEYIKPLEPNLHKAITIWMPLTPVGKYNGQLIYFPKSDYIASRSEQISLEGSPLDLDMIPELKSSPWFFPIIEYGDLLVHTMDVIHSSFPPEADTYTRLSIDLRYVNNLQYTDSRWLNPWRGDDKF